MDGLRTRGQPVAVTAIRARLGSGLPHALLLAGPAGVGKTTLALDIAAALLCRGEAGLPRPCRACRGCRMVGHGNHPDLHRLPPRGPPGPLPRRGRGARRVRAEQGAADAPTAARLARITDGRPGHAIAYARAPEAVVLRSEIARTLLDLLDTGVTGRIAGIRELGTRSVELVRALDAGAARASAAAGIDKTGASGRGRSRVSRAAGLGAAATLTPAGQPAHPAPGGAAETI